MRWKTAWVCALSLAGTLGCPHAFGRGGTIDKAIHKDLMERLKDGKCSREDLASFCTPGMDLEQCLSECE